MPSTPSIRRPNSLLGLLFRAARLRPKAAAGVLALLAIPVMFCFGVFPGLNCLPIGPAAATFNIENYPKSPTQEEGAFAAMGDVGAKLYAVQEITDTAAFCAAAKKRLGSSWECTFADRPIQRVGIIFDSRWYFHLNTTLYSETETYDGAKPTLGATFLGLHTTPTLQVFVVHLKAGGDSAAVRAGQLKAITKVIAAAVKSGDRVMMLGDFNATGPEDVKTIAAFAKKTGLQVASAQVPCTAYWNRKDGCLGVTLDHVLTSFDAEVQAEGPCKTEGCAMRPSCPTFHSAVSDHCPVSVRF